MSTPNAQLRTPKGHDSTRLGENCDDLPGSKDFQPVAAHRSACSFTRGLRLRRRSGVAVGLAVGFLVWLRCGALPPGLLDPPPPSTMVVDRNGVPLYEALSGDGTRSAQLTPASIPDTVAAATVAAEDRRFWSHYGVDPIAILRAMKRNLSEGQIVEGGSTISQQAAKLLLLRQSPQTKRGWRTKVREAVIAIRLEHRLTKREILALY